VNPVTLPRPTEEDRNWTRRILELIEQHHRDQDQKQTKWTETEAEATVTLTGDRTVTATRKNIVDGTVEVCCHRVSYWYEVPKRKQTEELREKLEEASEERARECINDECSSGELCFYDTEAELEYRGWWTIERD
jgi:hypothetical protein